MFSIPGHFPAWLVRSIWTLWLVTLAALLFSVIQPTYRITLLPEQMRPHEGQSYARRTGAPLWSPVVAIYDNSWNNKASRLMLLEDGQPLGPANALHSLVYEQGRGAFSYWKGYLFFSTSDNSDPRRNGRVYEADLPLAIGLTGWLAIIAVHLVALVRGRAFYLATATWLAMETLRLGRLLMILLGRLPAWSLRGIWTLWLVTLAALLFSVIQPTYRITLLPGQMRPHEGQSYARRTGPPLWSPVVAVHDSSWDSKASRLMLLEDGQPLGPANAMHSLVYKQGRGAFSYWNGHLFFSTSDNSDPRWNGRVYEADLPLAIGLTGWLAIIAVHLVALVRGRALYLATATSLALEALQLGRLLVGASFVGLMLVWRIAMILLFGAASVSRVQAVRQSLLEARDRLMSVASRALPWSSQSQIALASQNWRMLRFRFWSLLARPREAWTAAERVRRREIVAIMLVAAMPLVGPYLMGSARILFIDIVGATLPMKMQAIRAMAAGMLPLWGPELGMGLPLVGDGITQLYDIRNLWWFVLPPLDAYVAMLVTSRSLYMVVAYLYFRQRLGFSPGPALVACCVYFCGTLFVMEVSFSHLATALEALPMLIWLTEKVLDRPRLRSGLGLAFGWLLVMTTSSVAYFIFFPFLMFAWGFMIGVYGAPEERLRRLGHFVLWFWIAIIWGLVLFAFVLLPFVEMLSLSNRGTEYGSDPFAWRSLWGLLVGPATSKYGFLNAPFSFFFYVGIVALPLILMSLVQRDNARLKAIPWLAGATLGGIFILSTPVKQVLAPHLPILNTFAFFRVSFFWGFLAAVLIGYALNRPRWRPTREVVLATRVLIFIQGAVVISIGFLFIRIYATRLELPEYTEFAQALTSHLAPSAFAVAAIIYAAIRFLGLSAALKPGGAGRRGAIGMLLSIELLAFFTFFNLGPAQPLPETGEVAFLRQKTTHDERVIQVFDFNGRKSGLSGESDWAISTMHLNAKAWWPEFRAADVYSSLMPGTLWRFFRAIGDRPAPWRGASGTLVTERADSPLLPLLAARWIISRHVLDKDGPYELAHSGLNYQVYERKDALPRAYGVTRLIEASNTQIEDMLLCAADGQIHADYLSRTVWVGPVNGQLGPIRAGPPAEGACLGHVIRIDTSAPAITPGRVEADLGNRLEVSITMPEAGWLVVSDNFYPGWSARVNGREAPIRQAFLFARAIEVPAGESRIVFTYWPDAQRNGLIISALALLASLLACAVMWWRARVKSGPARFAPFAGKDCPSNSGISPLSPDP